LPLEIKTSSWSNTKWLLIDKVKIQDFEIGKKLGQGRFGTAYLAFHKSTGGVFAIKMVNK
jgi:serine/threonine protein kinase